MNVIYRFIGNPIASSGNIFNTTGAVLNARIQPNGVILINAAQLTSVTAFLPIPSGAGTLEFVSPQVSPLANDFNNDFNVDFGMVNPDPIQSCMFYKADGSPVFGSFTKFPEVVDIPEGAASVRVCYGTIYADAGILVLPGRGKPLAPVYSSEVNVSYEKEADQQFFRKKLDGTLAFVGNDYDWIMSLPFADPVRLLVQKKPYNGGAWEDYLELSFTRIDCTVDEDDKKISVQPEASDEYTDILSGWEKEYNIPDLPVETMPVLITKRPLLQIYVPGDSIITCFLSGMTWEQDATEVSDETELVNTYHFARASQLAEADISVSGGAPSAYAGIWAGKITDATGTNEERTVTLRLPGSTATIKLTTFNQFAQWRFEAYLEDGGETLYYYKSNSIADFRSLAFTMTAFPDSSAVGSLSVDLSTYSVYMRYLLDAAEINGTPTYPLPSEDMSGDNRNYRRVIGYAIDIAQISANLSDTATEWGMADNGKYFLPPSSALGQVWNPVGRSAWRNSSLWFSEYYADDFIEELGRVMYIFRDAYKLSSVISVLLAKIAPDLSFEATEEYSRFLYGGGVADPIGGDRKVLCITPKTNILNGLYSQPQQTAQLTLKTVLDMLANTMQLYWFVEDGKLRIEHIRFFKNGGSYSASAAVGYDLTALKSPKLGKAWAFHTSSWSYDKEDIPERMEFAWSDEGSMPFDGMPIEVLSSLVNAGSIESINVAKFMSDIDMMLLNPSSISEDGFALFGATQRNILPGSIEPSPLRVASGPGYYLSDGSVQYDSSGFGKGWTYVKLRCLPGTEYVLTNAGSSPVVIWTLFREDNTVALYDTVAGPSITTTSDTAYIGLSWRNSLNSLPSAPYPVLNILNVASIVEQTYSLPFVKLTMDGEDYELQNGLLAFAYMQPLYWLDDLPAWSEEINGETVQATGVRRTKQQEVSFPAGTDDPDTQELVKTAIGNGQIEEISVNLSSRMAKATLVYDIEQ